MKPFSRLPLLAALLLACGSILAADCLADEASAPPALELLWPDGAPGAAGDEEADKPGLWVYRAPADKATGAAVVVCPGGGYGFLAVDHEGHDVARWLNSLGVTTLVLKYRVAPRYHHPAPLNDAQRALRLARARAREWNIDPARLGVMGFSAGGHLASTVGTHFDSGAPDAADPIDQMSSRPDFMILCYPVISFTTEYVHAGSRNNLLGADASEDLVRSFSNELQVTGDTPPTFLFHTDEDSGVPPENSVLFYLALRKARVPAELHIYEKGKHGVGLAPADPVLSTWPGLCAAWFEGRKLLDRPASR